MIRLTLTAFALVVIAITTITTPLGASAAAIDSTSGETLVSRWSTGGFGIYNCGHCEAQAQSHSSTTPVGTYIDCIKEAASAITKDYDAGAKAVTSYELSEVKGTRGHGDDGSFGFVKALQFHNIKFVPSAHTRGFNRENFHCSNDLTAYVECAQCRVAH